jgi:hypothetical protein
LALSPADASLVDALISHQLDLLRLDAHLQARVLALLNRLQDELSAKLRQTDLTDFNRQRTAALLRDTTSVIDRYYKAIDHAITPQIQATQAITATAAARAIDAAATAGIAVSLRASLPTTAAMRVAASDALVFGAATSSWWKKQSADTAFRFANAVRAGIVAGETSEQIVRRVTGSRTVKGVMDVSRANARGLVQSSVMSAANAARRATYEANRDLVKGWRQLSTLDGNTTDICIAYSNAEWNLDYKPINRTTLPYENGTPRHWGCRSLIVPILKTFRELGIDIPDLAPATRASALGPVPATTTFEQFLRRRTVEQQNEQLGKGRAAMWRAGKITLRQLLDLHGNPLTFAQLKAKYGD